VGLFRRRLKSGASGAWTKSCEQSFDKEKRQKPSERVTVRSKRFRRTRRFLSKTTRALRFETITGRTVVCDSDGN
jgi:hypothetical protein